LEDKVREGVGLPRAKRTAANQDWLSKKILQVVDVIAPPPPPPPPIPEHIKAVSREFWAKKLSSCSEYSGRMFTDVRDGQTENPQRGGYGQNLIDFWDNLLDKYVEFREVTINDSWMPLDKVDQELNGYEWRISTRLEYKAQGLYRGGSWHYSAYEDPNGTFYYSAPNSYYTTLEKIKSERWRSVNESDSVAKMKPVPCEVVARLAREKSGGDLPRFSVVPSVPSSLPTSLPSLPSFPTVVEWPRDRLNQEQLYEEAAKEGERLWDTKFRACETTPIYYAILDSQILAISYRRIRTKRTERPEDTTDSDIEWEGTSFIKGQLKGSGRQYSTFVELKKRRGNWVVEAMSPELQRMKAATCEDVERTKVFN
jgi:hypothetical protein